MIDLKKPIIITLMVTLSLFGNTAWGKNNSISSYILNLSSLSKTDADPGIKQSYIQNNKSDTAILLENSSHFVPNAQQKQFNAKSLKEKGNDYYKKGMIIQALECYRKSLQLLTESTAVNDTGVAHLNYLSAYVLYELSRSDSAIFHLKRALAIYESGKDTLNMILMLNDLGLNCMVNGRLKEAVSFFIRGIRLSESIGGSRYLATLYVNIGLVNSENGNYELALECFERSINEHKRRNETYRSIYPINAMGGVYLQQKKYKQALDRLFDALRIAQTQQDSTVLGFIHRLIGDTYLAMDDMDNSKIYLQESMSLLISSSPLEKVETYISLSKYYLARKEYLASIFYGNKAFQIGNKINALSPLKQCALQLSLAHEKIGNLEYALKFRKTYEALSDSLLSEEKSKYINQLQLDYDFEKKQQFMQFEHEKRELASHQEINRQRIIRNYSVILFLTFFVFTYLQVKNIRKIKKAYVHLNEQNNTIIQQKNDLQVHFKQLEISQQELKEVNAAKDKFFSILAHDLRNPFNVILGFSDFLVSDWDDLDDNQKLSMMKELHKSAQNTYALLENLLVWGQIQQKRVTVLKEKLNLTDLVNTSIAPYLSVANKKNIQVRNDVSAKHFIFVDKFTMGIVIGNLVNNAIKFTPENGNITISVLPDSKNNIKMCVTDSGVGIKPERIETLFRLDENYSTPGTNDEKGTGLGLILCKEFVEKNGGIIYVNSVINQGSQFIIQLPNEKHS